jgi:broad specificity phosphatase PhoE
MELYLIRHGQSTNNLTAHRGEREREPDPPLTELGQQQAALLAGRLAHSWNVDTYLYQHPAARESITGVGITQLLVSPMRRALQTTLPLSQELGIAAEVSLAIFENGGVYLEDDDGVTRTFPGLTRQELSAEFPTYKLPPGLTDSGWHLNSAPEDFTACQARAIRLATELKAVRFSAQRIAVVSHGTFLAQVIKAFLNLLPGDDLRFTLYNTSVTRFDFLPDGMLHLRYLNRVDHLAPEQVS